MRTFRAIVMVLAVLLTVPLIIALFIPKSYVIAREATINKPVRDVYDYVKLLHNQDKYNKWVMSDPNIKQDFQGTDGTVGAIVAWEGNNKVGKGVQEIKEVTEASKVTCEIRFERPMKDVAMTTMALEPVGAGQTKVRWSFEGHTAYPMNLFNLLVDKLLGRDLETSLNNLKTILEK